MRRGLEGIEPTPARPNGAGYACLNLSATAGINFKKQNNYCLALFFEELDVSMLTLRSGCSNNVKICIGRALEAAASLSPADKTVAESVLTKMQLTLNGVKLCSDMWASNRDSLLVD